MDMEIKRISKETVASSKQDVLEIRISKMVQHLLKQGHIIYSIIKYEDDSMRRKYRANLHYWILEREELSKLLR